MPYEGPFYSPPSEVGAPQLSSAPTFAAPRARIWLRVNTPLMHINPHRPPLHPSQCFAMGMGGSAGGVSLVYGSGMEDPYGNPELWDALVLHWDCRAEVLTHGPALILCKH